MGGKQVSRRDLVRRGSVTAAGLAIASDAAGTYAQTATPSSEGSSGTPETATMIRVGNEHISLGFDLREGLALVSILDSVTGHEYLPASRAGSRTIFFLLRDGRTFYTSRSDFAIVEATRSPDGHHLRITASGTTLPLVLTLDVTAAPGQPAAICELSVRSEATERLPLQFEYPKIQEYAVGTDAGRAMGALPIEIGVVGPLRERPTLEGGDVDPTLGMSHTMTAMQVASIYAPDGGGGVFFADLDGGSFPLEFSLSDDQVLARWASTLEPGEEVALPRLAIGVHHEGDWRQAVDYYVSHHQPSWRFPEIPAWLREAGAIYAYGGEGGGGILQQQPTITLKDRIGSFDNLPRLLDEARQLGTNVVYLYDYWEGTDEGNQPPYWNKGDYVPRADMGGAEAFKAGMAAIREQGGRVILYVEPFIVFAYSQIGLDEGAAWAGRNPRGDLYTQYADNYTMCSTLAPWQEYVADMSRRLVAEFGADGIYLDSYGWQWNWPCFSPEDNALISAAAWNQGVLDLIDRVRTAVRQVHPEAVVLTEAMNELLAQHVDGGLDASFAWHLALNGGQLLASPLRYALPQANVYSNGRDLNQLNQVYAAGHSLILGPHWLSDAEHIRPLVELRQRHSDALVHGRQVYQPETGSAAVGAYLYEGDQSQIITAVNTAAVPYEGRLTLRSTDAASRWRDLMTDEIVSTGGDGAETGLPLAIPAEGVRVLMRAPS